MHGRCFSRSLASTSATPPASRRQPAPGAGVAPGWSQESSPSSTPPTRWGARPAGGPHRRRPGRLRIVKGTQSAFAFGVTIGRTENNDVVLRNEDVSRFHAYVQTAKGGYTLADADSKNGTFIDGVRLSPNKPTPLPPSCRSASARSTSSTTSRPPSGSCWSAAPLADARSRRTSCACSRAGCPARRGTWRRCGGRCRCAAP